MSRPYALFGDWQGEYGPGVFLPGTHVVTATPYAEVGAGGDVGQSLRLELTFVQESPFASDALAQMGSPDAFYQVWSESYGSTTDVTADANNNGQVDLGDFTLWRDRYGSVAFSLMVPAVEHVPTPPAAVQLVEQAAGTPIDGDRPSAATETTNAAEVVDAALLLLERRLPDRHEIEWRPATRGEFNTDQPSSSYEPLDSVFGEW